MNIVDLPAEILYRFFATSNILDKIRMKKVCKKFNSSVTDVLLHQSRLSISKYGQSLAKGCNCCDKKHQIDSSDLIDLEDLSLYNLYDCLRIIFAHCPSIRTLDLIKLTGIDNRSSLLHLIAENYGETLECFTYDSFPVCVDDEILYKFKSLKHLTIDDITGSQLLTLISNCPLEGLEASRYTEDASNESVLAQLPGTLKVLKITKLCEANLNNLFNSPACESLEVLEITLNHDQSFPSINFKLPCLQHLTFSGTVDVNNFIKSLYNSPHLTFLDLQSTYHSNFNPDLENRIHSFLWQNFFHCVPKLKTLLFPPSIFDDSIVTCMIRSCPQLERIENPCVQLTDESLITMASASNLSIIDFGSSPFDAINTFTSEGICYFLSKTINNILLLNLRSETSIITSEVEEMISKLIYQGKLKEVILNEKRNTRYHGIHLKRKK